MPQQPSSPGATRSATALAEPPPRSDLTVNKVIAGAGAAATSAVLGSFFGAEGTVAGAAIGSVASTVATSLYQRSLDRTRDRLAGTLRPVTSRRGGTPTVPLPLPGGSTEPPTVRLRVEPVVVPGRVSRRRVVGFAVATALVFALALAAVTGVEWIKGSTLAQGQSGTSVGRVLTGDSERAGAADNTGDGSGDGSGDSSGDGSGAQRDGERGGVGSTPSTPAPSKRTHAQDPTLTPTPQTPDPGAGLTVVPAPVEVPGTQG